MSSSRGRPALPQPEAGFATPAEIKAAIESLLSTNASVRARILTDWFDYYCAGRVSPPLGCWLLPASRHTTNEGYPSAVFYWPRKDRLPTADTLRGRKDVFVKGFQQIQYQLMHRVAAMHTSLRVPSPDDHASHRCHQRACFNPAHLMLEHRLVNQQRKNCTGTLCLSGLDGFRYLVLCRHRPACLNITRASLSQTIPVESIPVVTDVFVRDEKCLHLLQQLRDDDEVVSLCESTASEPEVVVPSPKRRRV